MLLIPAIDIKDGQCVRLRQGRFEDATVYGDDPVAMAAHWCEAGARRLHLVDLDGAVAGQPACAAVVARIARDHPGVPVQVGGGVRDIDTVAAYVDAGVSQVIIGTAAVRDPDFVTRACVRFPGAIVVGLDARNGKVAVSGWLEDSAVDAVDLARRFAGDGIHSIVYTDIGRDGMLSGVNVEATAALAEAVQVPVVASGGVKSLDDIHALVARAHTGISGAITGRAIYEGTLDFAEGAALAARLGAGAMPV